MFSVNLSPSSGIGFISLIYFLINDESLAGKIITTFQLFKEENQLDWRDSGLTVGMGRLLSWSQYL